MEPKVIDVNPVQDWKINCLSSGTTVSAGNGTDETRGNDRVQRQTVLKRAASNSEWPESLDIHRPRFSHSVKALSGISNNETVEETTKERRSGQLSGKFSGKRNRNPAVTSNI
jgi:hypothetical protein